VLKNITKAFGSVVAVDNISLEIPDGQVTALLGPSGCGKTTTLLMLAGIYQPTRGEIFFDEVMVNGIPPKLRNVGLVFQSYALYPHMTVFENIAFPLKLKKVPKDEIRQRVQDIAKVVQIDDLLQRKPAQISGGQQQRVALCRALVKNPDLLLLDEPLSNLDARLRIETRAEIKRIQQELGITTILVTHDQVEAVTMADQVAVMRNGVIQQYSSPEDLLLKPANMFVASFMGDPPMNLMEAELSSENGKSVFRCGSELKIPVPDAIAAALQSRRDREFILGVRPENLELLDEPHELAVPGTVFMVELLGRDKLVDFRFGEVALRALVPADVAVSQGEKKWIRPQAHRIHLFGKADRQAVPLAG
jgi:ABC-type sugar transport system ATPase subunit